MAGCALKSTATTHNASKNKQVRPPQQSDTKFNNQKANQHIKGNTKTNKKKLTQLTSKP